MGRQVFVTGGARGIGAAIAKSFAEIGDHVVVLDVIEPAAAVAGVDYVTCDVSVAESVRQAFAGVDAVDVLVNNAGIARHGEVGAQPAAEWFDVVRVHLGGTFLCTSAAVPLMSSGASIISIGSTAAFVALPGRSAYSAAKAGILALTRVLAIELAPRGIRANAVCPGFIKTDLIDQSIRSGVLDEASMLQRVPAGRLGEPRDIAQAVRHLASAEAAYITGQSIIVDGGWTIQGITEPRA